MKIQLLTGKAYQDSANYNAEGHIVDMLIHVAVHRNGNLMILVADTEGTAPSTSYFSWIYKPCMYVTRMRG